MKFFKIFLIAILLLGITGNKLFSQIPAPNLIEPQNNAVGVSLFPYFDWSDVENATSYSLQLSTSADFEFLIINETGLTVSNFETPQSVELEQFVQYFWRASASIGGQTSQWSEVWSFSTEYVPSLPVLLEPENGETNVPLSPEFLWQPVLNATGYHLQVSTDDEFSNIIIDEPNLTGASFLGSGLNFETQYWWRVLAFNPLISTPWSEVWFFITGNSIIIGNGTSFNSTNIYPAPYGNAFSGARQQFLILADEINEAAGYPGLILNIGFNVQSTNNCGVLNDFQIKMKQTNANSITSFDNEDLFQYYSNSSYQPIVGWNNHSLDEPFNWDGVSNILIDICFSNYPNAPTANASTYYTETSFTSAVFDYSNENSNICNNNTNAFLSNLRPNILFSTGAITWPIINLIDPINNAVNVSLTPTFTWNCTTSEYPYHIQVSANPDFSELLINEIVNVETYESAIELDINTQYWWRVGIEDDGYYIWSDIWTFTTENELPLEAPNLISPEVEEMVYLPALLSWESVENADGYHIQVSENYMFTDIVFDQLTADTQIFANNLSTNAPYYWRVLAYNQIQTSEWSAIWTFFTSSYFVIGNGTGYNSSTSYPAPYGNAFSGVRQQFLITAEEINEISNTMGLFDINEIGFNVQSVNNCGALTYIEIRMKLTIDNSITTWDNDGFTSVYANPSYQPVLGWNTHNLVTPFYWDGISNILVDICFNNYPNVPTANASTYYTETDFTSAIYDYTNENINICNNNANSNLSNFRPNVMLGFSPNPLPITPALLDPDNYATNQSVLPFFQWMSALDDFYIQVSTNSSFTDLVIDEFIDDDWSYQTTTPLLNNTQYWWRVRGEYNGELTPWSNVRTFTTEPTSLQINLNTGWNTISSNVIPESPEMPDVFSGISSNTILVKNGLGEIYSPVFGINNIGNWDINDGYLVYMNSSNSLNIFGANIIPENTPINLVSGWNLISYLRAAPMDAALAFSNILPYLVLAKNNNGDIFSPQFGLNNIGNLLTGQGYWLYMSAPAVLVYPSN